ncbi:MAG: sodium:sulfate symporter [Deltaproteobacteria bacterium CG11_big_fil_rev_8_21_14_0_20_47_16]|nr:MAG: sodium:sulfate symporter [Deltaproteobacteria bacterium CG11_big_fil_rev_8_21_14_0_20_47_16]
MKKWLIFLIALCAAIGGLHFFVPPHTLSKEQYFMLIIFILAALLWITDVIPLFATALLIIGLEILMLANPGKWAIFGFEHATPPTVHAILVGAVDPVLLLFLGGFCLARVAQNSGVDQTVSALIVRVSRSHPALLLFNIMLATACFSMWMSNTATTAMMFSVLIPLLNSFQREHHSFKKAFLLGVPFAANIGGMGTPIGSPPNAVALGFLDQQGYSVDFLKWMALAVPLMLGLLIVTWLLLSIHFKLKQPIKRQPIPKAPLNAKKFFVIVIFALTVILWLTNSLHGLPSSLVALFPIIIFSITGLLGRHDINHISWDALILIAGGLALGSGFMMTGFDQVLAGWLTSSTSTNTILLVMPFVVATFALSTFISNTAAANLLLPIGIAYCMQMKSLLPELSYQMAISIALCASVAMALPVSTPPNQIAYSEGGVTTRDFIFPGLVIGGLGVVLILLFGKAMIHFWGIA